MQQTISCMKARIKRAMNSKNLGTRIMPNGALDQKILALEVFRGKTAFSGGWRVLAQKIGTLANFGEFLGFFAEFWRV
jgi:hypothetical protein